MAAKYFIALARFAIIFIFIATLAELSWAATIRCVHDRFTDVCGVTQTASERSCCDHIRYSATFKISGESVGDHPSGRTKKTCCQGPWARYMTNYCTNDFGSVFCSDTKSTHCCVNQVLAYGSWYRGCCDFRQTSCPRPSGYHIYCGSANPYCCVAPTRSYFYDYGAGRVMSTCINQYSTCCPTPSSRSCNDTDPNILKSCLSTDGVTWMTATCNAGVPNCCVAPFWSTSLVTATGANTAFNSSTCVSQYSSCCNMRVTSKECGARRIGGQGLADLLFSTTLLAVVVLLVSMAVVPVPMVVTQGRSKSRPVV